MDEGICCFVIGWGKVNDKGKIWFIFDMYIF